jgi:para-aminobenzoate synthetase component 1
MSAVKPEKWYGADAATCAQALSARPYTLFFDSNRPSHPLSRYSIVCWNPVERIETKNGIIRHNDKDIGHKDFFAFLKERLSAYDFEMDNTVLPFSGGAAGYFGYDLGRGIETIPSLAKDDLQLPDACVGIYKNVLVFDEKETEAWIIAEREEKEALRTHLEQASKENFVPDDLNWTPLKTNQAYLEDIKSVIDYIYAGEVYQINLSRRFEASLPGSFNSFSHYEHLRRVNPAPFSAFMNFGDFQLSSTSPERFLWTDGNAVETCPIKGTLPSARPAQELTGSVKDRAENTMIVDLLRNDLSKVCDFHSVKVPDLCRLETFEGLHHLVSTVKGVLQKDKDAIDLLKACFPGGSITGAPKIRAMEIVEKLEPTQRGPYCGAMGYIGFNGVMDTNIIIRTLIYKDDKVYLQTGSGIVSDSVPEKELQETLDKAGKIFESFETGKKKENAA